MSTVRLYSQRKRVYALQALLAFKNLLVTQFVELQTLPEWPRMLRIIGEAEKNLKVEGYAIGVEISTHRPK